MKNLSKLLLRSLSRAARPYLKTVGLLQTAKVFNRSTLVWEPADEKVLVLAPHMDDEVIGCGGTIAKHVVRGADVTVVFLTDGGAGAAVIDSGQAPGDLTQTRTAEAHRALSCLGVQHSIFLGAEDGNLASTPSLAGTLGGILTKNLFDLIYLPFFLEEHPDHRATSQILLDAVSGTRLTHTRTFIAMSARAGSRGRRSASRRRSAR